MATNILRFPGVVEVSAAETDVKINLEDVISRQDDQLVRWRCFGEEVKRRVDRRALPFNLFFELYNLFRETI